MCVSFYVILRVVALICVHECSTMSFCMHPIQQLHWNTFGKQPRMLRGTVTRDRRTDSFMPPWLFRPVVATFTGIGVGEDTSDPTHAGRDSGKASSNSRDRRFDSC
jgi:hypothetical protein